MAQIDSVGQNTQDSFGNFRLIKSLQPVNLTATGNAVIALPILGGGTGGTTGTGSTGTGTGGGGTGGGAHGASRED